MLNPNRQLRLTIGQVESHHWIFGAFVEEFPPVDERWKRKAFQKYAKLNDLSMANLADQLSTHPFGQLGGVYNIEKHSHQLSKITLKKAPIRELEVINLSHPIYPSQISTSPTQFSALDIENRISN